MMYTILYILDCIITALYYTKRLQRCYMWDLVWGYLSWSLKTDSCHNANFAITGSTTDCHHDCLWCSHWQQSWHHGRHEFSVESWLPVHIVQESLYTLCCFFDWMLQTVRFNFIMSCQGWNNLYMPVSWSCRLSVYPMKYAHGLVCNLYHNYNVSFLQCHVIDSPIFIKGYFIGTGVIWWLSQCLWSNPGGYGKINLNKTHKCKSCP